MIQENYHEKFNRIIRRDTKPSKEFVYAIYEPMKYSMPDETLFSYGKENIIEKTIYEIQNFFIRIKAIKEFKSSCEEQKDFDKALNNIINSKLDIKPITKVEVTHEEEKIEEDNIIKEEISKDEVVPNKPKTLDDLYKQTFSILGVSEEQIQNYYLNKICDILETISYNYQSADVEQLKQMLQCIEKYQEDGIDQLNEKNNKKIQKILLNLHLCLTEQLLNLIQNNDFG